MHTFPWRSIDPSSPDLVNRFSNPSSLHPPSLDERRMQHRLAARPIFALDDTGTKPCRTTAAVLPNGRIRSTVAGVPTRHYSTESPHDWSTLWTDRSVPDGLLATDCKVLPMRARRVGEGRLRSYLVGSSARAIRGDGLEIYATRSPAPRSRCHDGANAGGDESPVFQCRGFCAPMTICWAGNERSLVRQPS